MFDGKFKDLTHFLLMYAMTPNISDVVGSVIAAGVLWRLMA